jgi:pimeloyl-ACP methyl ester carboxylesterase
MPLRLALIAALFALLAAVPASAAVPTGPAGDAFYNPATNLPGKTHGDPIWTRALTNEQTLAEASVNRLILYRSTSLQNKPIAVSGTIHLPKGKAPKGGWPVVSWAHATTGLGDQCAPSRNPGSGAIYAYHVYIEGLLDRWLKAGFAVVRTDYEGLGPKGVHPYLVGVSEGRGTLDIVRAARKTYKSIGPRVAIAGHSQGGHAAVFAAAIAPTWTPELQLRGTAALAPFAQGDEIFANTAGGDEPSRRTGYVALIARGFDAGYPKLGIQSLLSDRGKELFPPTLSLCITEITSEDSEFAKTAPNAFFRTGADLANVQKAIAANDPTDLRVKTPLLVQQGTADTTVFQNFTTAMVAGLRKRGAKVTYKTYQDVDHTFIAFGVPQDDVFAWTVKRLK